MFACAQESQPQFYLAGDVRDVRTAIVEFPGALRGTVLILLLPESPVNNPAKLFCVHVERKLDRTQLQRVCTEREI